MKKRRVMTAFFAVALAAVLSLSFLFAACDPINPEPPEVPPKAYTLTWQYNTELPEFTVDGYDSLPDKVYEDTILTIKPEYYANLIKVTVNGGEKSVDEGKCAVKITEDSTIVVTTERITEPFAEPCAITWEYEGEPDFAVEGMSELPDVVAKGTKLTIVSNKDNLYVTGAMVVGQNGTQSARASEGKCTVTIDENVAVTVSTAQKDVTAGYVGLKQGDGGKPTYIIGGEVKGYFSGEEIKKLYLDFEGDHNAHREDVITDAKVDIAQETFELTADISWATETDNILYPHFYIAGQTGDIKVDGSAAKHNVSVMTQANEGYAQSIVWNGNRYEIISTGGSPHWGIATVKITSTVGDITYEKSSPEPITDFQEIKLHEYFKEGLPRIDINTKDGMALDDQSLFLGNNKGLSKDVAEWDYVKANVTVTDTTTPANNLTLENDNDDSEYNAKVKIRGNYSSQYPKRPIRIKFNEKQKMCGLGNGKQKFKSWVLLAEYKDSSMMRNSVADYFGNTILESDGYYCTDYRYVEVYLNGNYNGLYVLAEQQEVKSDRVNIAEPLDPEDKDSVGKTEAELSDVHTGYFFEYDGYYINEKPEETFTINNDMGFGQNGYTISSDLYYKQYGNGRRDYLQRCVQSIWDIVRDAVKKSKQTSGQPFYALNPETGEKYKDVSIKSAREAIENVIDIRSLVDMFIEQELLLDMDISWSSFLLSLDMSETGNKKLTFTAPWDFDSAVGNAIRETDKFQSTGSLWHNGGRVDPNPWLALLVEQNWFWASVQAKWDMLEKAGAFTGVIQMIDDFSTNYKEAFDRNFKTWPQCLGGQEGQQTPEAYPGTHKGSVDYLKKWINERITNMTRLIGEKCTEYGIVLPQS